MVTLTLCFSGNVLAQQGTGILRGLVTDEFGGTIAGATVVATDQSGTQKTATTNNDGLYALAGLVPGAYSVIVTAAGFAPFQATAVDVAPGRREPLDIKLSVALAQEEVTVAAETPISTAPENNAGALVLRGSDLEALPEDPDDLASALQALAGPSAGPDGGQVYIDGFTGGRLPPRESIREIRINQNPFAAEYDRPGFGRIEILTRPGTDKFRGQAFFNFQDESLNARNPFVPNRAPFQQRFYGGNVSGPIIKKKSSFFFDFDKRDADNNVFINATTLDSNFNPSDFRLAVVQPVRSTDLSVRFDHQINQNNTLVARYGYEQNKQQDVLGNSEFTLLSRAYDASNNEHSFQITETAVLSPKVINETRFQFRRDGSEQNGDNSVPSINVLDAFSGGGSQVGISSDRQNRWELQNYATWAEGKHTIKFGGRVRGINLNDSSVNNFGGTYTFTGGRAVPLDADNQPIVGADPVTITSIERYRRTLLFQQRGLSAAEIRALGGGAAQFSISGGDPESKISQVDFGGFVQDDWRVRPDLTLSGGLRYETQSNIDSKFNFAPRIGLAWSPGVKSGGAPAGGAAGFGQPQNLVIRAGFGIFYDRFSENYTLQATRFNGLAQQLFFVREGAVGNPILDLYPNVPTIETLNSFAQPQATRRIDPTLQAPYTMQGVFSVEKQLPRGITVFTTFITQRSLHTLRLRNINAPVPGSITADSPSGYRPLGPIGDVLEYESNGIVNQNQLIFGTRSRLSQKISVSAFYTLNRARGNADGGFGQFGGGGGASAPANPYDLDAEYGRASFDQRHRFFLFGSFTMPWKVQLNPFIVANSGQPFNIFTGVDNNRDSVFNDRPAFATDPNKLGVVETRYGLLDPNPEPGQETIPRNFGQGPNFFGVNLNVSRTFGFGAKADGSAAGGAGGPGGGGGGGRRGGGGGPFGGGGGGPFGGGGGSSENRYNLTASVRVNNLLNHPNFATPNGNLSSSFFDQSTRTASGFGGGGGGNSGSRQIQLQLRFSF
ncbi:MAG: carboxypeptidase regulatory-like domain-containing protein [Pyrinomonadaceae bacterium]